MEVKLLPDAQVTPDLFEVLCSNIQTAVSHRFNQNIDKGKLREFAARVLGFADYNHLAPTLKGTDKEDKPETGKPAPHKPAGLFAPVISHQWHSDEHRRIKSFDQYLEMHRREDESTGFTSKYSWDNLFEKNEVDGIRAALDQMGSQHLAGEWWINQHAQHAIEKFYSQVQFSYDGLLADLEKLTFDRPQGRVIMQVVDDTQKKSGLEGGQ